MAAKLSNCRMGSKPVPLNIVLAKSLAMSLMSLLMPLATLSEYFIKPISFISLVIRSYSSSSSFFANARLPSGASTSAGSASSVGCAMMARTSSESASIFARPTRAMLSILTMLIATPTPTPMSLLVAEALALMTASVRFCATTCTPPFMPCSQGALPSSPVNWRARIAVTIAPSSISALAVFF